MDEVEDICKVLNWKCSVFETEYPDNKFVAPINDSDYGNELFAGSKYQED